MRERDEDEDDEKDATTHNFARKNTASVQADVCFFPTYQRVEYFLQEVHRPCRLQQLGGLDGFTHPCVFF